MAIRKGGEQGVKVRRRRRRGRRRRRRRRRKEQNCHGNRRMKGTKMFPRKGKGERRKKKLSKTL